MMSPTENIDVMLDEVSDKTGFPFYKGAFKAGASHPLPPAQYITYTMMQSPDAFSDDTSKMRSYYIYATLFSVRADTLSRDTDALIAAFGSCGFTCVSALDNFEKNAKYSSVSFTLKTEVWTLCP